MKINHSGTNHRPLRIPSVIRHASRAPSWAELASCYWAFAYVRGGGTWVKFMVVKCINHKYHPSQESRQTLYAALERARCHMLEIFAGGE